MKAIKTIGMSLLALSIAGCQVDQQPQKEEAKAVLSFIAQDTGVIKSANGNDLSYQVHSRSSQNGLQSIAGEIDDPLRSAVAGDNNFHFSYDRMNKEGSGLVELSQGHYWITLDAQGTLQWQKIDAPEVLDEVLPATEEMQKSISRAVAGGEQDSSGRYVVDVLVGYSNSAANYVGNINTHAAMLVQSVNTALTNSNITNVYVRLVGAATSPENPGVVTSALRDGKTWFATELEATGADFLSLVQTPTGAPGSAGGWAYAPGDIQVIGAPWPSAYRHEVGHSVGGIHCKPEGGSRWAYGYGFNTGNGGTAQCGNNLPYYSSPLIRDADGNPMGTSHSQDMARLWRERAEALSGIRVHKIPFPGEDDDFKPLLGYNDHCVTAPNNATNMAVVTLAECDGSNQQNWRMNSAGQLMPESASNYCLEAGTQADIQRAVFLYQCHSGVHQRWQWDGGHLLNQVNLNRAMDASFAEPGKIHIIQKHNGENQQWRWGSLFRHFVEAEDYTYMSGIQLEATTDTGGGQNVGWIDAGDWLTYDKVDIPEAGTYTVEFRVASLNGGGRLWFEKAGGQIQYGKMDVPETGGWQNWTTTTMNVELPAGSQHLAIYAEQGGWNINWLRIKRP